MQISDYEVQRGSEIFLLDADIKFYDDGSEFYVDDYDIEKVICYVKEEDGFELIPNLFTLTPEEEDKFMDYVNDEYQYGDYDG